MNIRKLLFSFTVNSSFLSRNKKEFLTSYSHINNKLEVKKFFSSRKSSELEEQISFSYEHFKRQFPLKISKNICLDKLEPEGASELFELIDRNRLYLKKTLPWLNYSNSVKDSQNFISQANDNFLNKSLILGIREKKLIGIISFNTIDWGKKEATIGYWLDQEMQGKGIATISCKALVDLGFSDLRLQKILISCSTQNVKSQLVAKRLGFKEECLIQSKEFLYDHYVDHILFSKTEKDYLVEHEVVLGGSVEEGSPS